MVERDFQVTILQILIDLNTKQQYKLFKQLDDMQNIQKNKG